MKPISEWSLFTKLASGLAVLTTLGGVATFGQTVVESDYQPFALKYQVAANTQSVLNGLNQIQWNQAIERFNNLQFQLGQLATQQIMLSDAVKREPENVLARLRLQEMDADIAQKKRSYELLKCQIEKRSTGATCP